MQLEGSCHCGAVRFRCESRAPYPFMYCYCSICRKTAGAGGYAINLHAEANSLEVEGEEHITVYRAWTDHPRRTRRSEGERRFCRHCGSALWVWDPRWPELMHPFASAIDSPLPKPPERTHILLASKPDWVPVPDGRREWRFDGYPDESLMDWHERHDLKKR
ncbi:MAG: GFA family protein [Ectothiorhodospiraceae bacterium]|nr:GFA family protein [Ectothiorhodospiraceae bacterium]